MIQKTLELFETHRHSFKTILSMSIENTSQILILKMHFNTI